MNSKALPTGGNSDIKVLTRLLKVELEGAAYEVAHLKKKTIMLR